MTDNTAHWQAHLALEFAQRYGKTVLSHSSHHGPLMVQRPFYPEGDTCHVYILHPPSGIVAGDALTITAKAHGDSSALITTPAAAKFYRSEGRIAKQQVQLSVADNAALEWLPQETIVYEGAKVSSQLQLNLAAAARFIGWEILVLGRPAANEGFSAGSVTLNWQVRRAEKIYYQERLQLDSLAFAARWGMNAHSSCGALLAYPCDSQQLQAVQELIGSHPARGVTLLDELLICRALDDRADVLRGFFEHVWQILRVDIMQKPACAPRIWAT